MVFFNHATRQMTAKIVYYGPGLCGKTTNLNTIYGKTSPKARGEMVSLNTETDRTLFFDLLPLDVGMVGGFKTKLQLYTVPGQVFYNSTRKLVLKGVDGVVFVVDSQSPMLDANKESLQNLEENMRELGLDLRDIPMVFQWNKRDLKNTVPVGQLEEELNSRRAPTFQAVASDGTGVFETLRGITKLVLAHIKTNVLGETAAPKEPRPPQTETPKPGPQAAPVAAPVAAASEPEPARLGLPEPTRSPEPPPPPVGSSPEPAPAASSAPVLSFLDEMPASSVPTQELPPEPVPAARPKAPVPAAVPHAHPPKAAPRMAPLKPLVAPQRPLLPSAHPVVASPLLPRMAPPVLQAPKPKAVPSPRATASALLGDMSQMSLFGGSAALKLDLPAEIDGHEIEIVVQVRVKEHTVAQASLRKPTPGKGILSKLSIELKRG